MPTWWHLRASLLETLNRVSSDGLSLLLVALLGYTNGALGVLVMTLDLYHKELDFSERQFKELNTAILYRAGSWWLGGSEHDVWDRPLSSGMPTTLTVFMTTLLAGGRLSSDGLSLLLVALLGYTNGGANLAFQLP